MNDVASLELSKELYERSGWEDTYLRWANFKEPRVVNADEWAKNMEGEPDLIASGDSVYVDQTVLTPAYDLGYLLRKLDFKRTKVVGSHNEKYETTHWRAQVDDRVNEISMQGDTPEDAACNLAIELFKRGILERGDDEQ